MKTSATPKLLAALIIGLGSVTFASSAMADNNGNGNDNGYGSSDNSSKSSSDNSNNSSKSSSNSGKQGSSSDDGRASNSCTGVVTNACGISFIKTTCTGSAANSNTDDHDEGKKDSHGRDESDDNHYGKTDSDGKSDDKDRVSLDHSDKTGKRYSDGSDASKVYVCHRMGGASVTLSVANDGWLHGHSKHVLDTVGKCSDFDGRDRSHDDDDSKHFSASDVEIAHLASPANPRTPAITPNVLSCLSAPAGTQVTVNGVTYTAPGGNAPGVTISIPSGFSAGGAGPMPSRGGVRSLR